MTLVASPRLLALGLLMTIGLLALPAATAVEQTIVGVGTIEASRDGARFDGAGPFDGVGASAGADGSLEVKG